jgi:hypothetical protein
VTEPCPPRWETGDRLPEARQSTLKNLIK